VAEPTAAAEHKGWRELTTMPFHPLHLSRRAEPYQDDIRSSALQRVENA
jgi:hypothetical protein